jgi:hypothetical protein
MKNFEKYRPEGYQKVLVINAKDKRTAILFNVLGFIILAAVLAVAALPLIFSKITAKELFALKSPNDIWILYGIFLLSFVAYIVLHELAHGAAYKLLTGEKLTYGIALTCAFCGVPNIYVYRRTSLIATATPLVLFTLILLPITVALYFVHPLYYLASSFLLASHLSGCIGDILVLIVLLKDFKDPRTLVRDVGPQQVFYVPENTTQP